MNVNFKVCDVIVAGTFRTVEVSAKNLDRAIPVAVRKLKKMFPNSFVSATEHTYTIPLPKCRFKATSKKNPSEEYYRWASCKRQAEILFANLLKRGTDSVSLEDEYEIEYYPVKPSSK